VIRDRVERARSLLGDRELDMLLVGQSTDFRYLTGRRIGLTERLTALLLPSSGRPQIVVPRLTEPLLGAIHGDADVHPWADGEDPVDRVVELLTAAGVRRVAIGEELWSSYLFALQARLPHVEFVPGAGVLRDLRAVKAQDEIDCLVEAGRRHDLVYEEFCATKTMIGRTELEIQRDIRELMIHHGLADIVWVDVGAGPNGASPLHPGGDRVVQPGDPVVLDYAGSWGGYYGDICRVPVAGEPSAEFVRAYEAVADAVQAAYDRVRPGVPCEDLDRAARDVIEARGFGEHFLHRLGHGIGLAAHEHPYLVTGNREPLAAGMAFSIEPGIYIEGQWGVRIEDIVVVTADGALNTNAARRDLVCLS
jgi:Xaa-Pro aminopeptidase